MKHLVTIFLLTFSFLLNAQVKEVTLTKTQLEEINTTFKNYLSDVQASEKDWLKITNYTYAPLFDLLSQEDMIVELKKTFNNNAYYTTFDVMEVLGESNSIVFSEIYYSKIQYDSQFTFHFKEDKDQTKEELDFYIDFMTNTFQNKFKEMNVIRNNNTIVFKGKKTILAVFDPNNKDWKMVEYIPNNEIYYSIFLPKEVASYLGK